MCIMLKYITHENSEDGRRTVVTLEDEQGGRHELLLDDVPTAKIESERSRLASLHHDIHHWGYEPPECCHCHQIHAFSGIFCGLDHPMDYFRVYCATCPDVNKEVETPFNQPVIFYKAGEFPVIDLSKMEVFEPKPPTQEEIDKTRRENHCHV